MVALAVLRRNRGTDAALRELWLGAARARAAGVESIRPCPHCRNSMAEVKLPVPDAPMQLEVCMRCQSVWFDPGELAEFRGAGTDGDEGALAPRTVRTDKEDASHAPDREVTVEAPERSGQPDLASALEKWVRTVGSEEYRKDTKAAAAEVGEALQGAWKTLLGYLVVPVDSDVPPLSAKPLATWGLAGALAFVFILTGGGGGGGGGGGAASSFGFVPAQWSRYWGLTGLTSFFIHAGLLHIALNVYFLLVFGDNVEDRLGRVKFAVLLVLAQAAGLGVFLWLNPTGTRPHVGASAGIAGIAAYYAAAFPKARMLILLRPSRAPIQRFHFPAWLMFVAYGGLQLAWSCSGAAPLGGAAVGFAWASVSRWLAPYGATRAGRSTHAGRSYD